MKDAMLSVLAECELKLEERMETLKHFAKDAEDRVKTTLLELQALKKMAEGVPSSFLTEMGTPVVGRVEIHDERTERIELRTGNSYEQLHGLYNRPLTKGKYRVLLFFQKEKDE